MDIYTFNFYTQLLTNLTPDTLEYDEHSHFNNDGSKVLWMSSRNVQNDSLQNPKAEYWLMNSDGSNKTQLTFFNDSTTADYKNFAQRGRVIASDNVWSPFGGDTALCYLQIYDSTGAYHQELVYLAIPSTINFIPSVKSSNHALSIFPNPSASSKLNIQLSLNPRPNKIYILDITERKIAEYNFSDQINISQLNSGIYFVQVAEGKNRYTQKLVVTK